MSNVQKVKKDALNWYKKYSHRRIVKRSDFSNESVLKFLLKEDLLYRLNRNFYLIKKIDEQPETVFNLFYWLLVKKTLEHYQPYAIKGGSAIRFYLGDQSIYPELAVRTAKSISHTLNLGFNKKIVIRPDPYFKKELTNNLSVAGINFDIDKGEKIILSKIKKDKDYFLFLQSYKFDVRLLELLYEKNPQPIVFKNLIADFQKIGRRDLAQRIGEIIKKYTPYRLSLKPNKFLKILEPIVVIKEEKKRPWVLRQEEQILRFEQVIKKKFTGQIKKIKKYKLDYLLKKAREYKQYDIYHSTTIEGYQITPEEVQKVLLSKNTTIKEKDREKLRNRMAILGYHFAFDFVLEEIQKNYSQNFITQELIKNIFFNLFKPSIKAGIIDSLDLLQYRKNQVFIRNSNYVPPAFQKVLDLMESLEEIVNTVKSPLIKSILAHYLFVTIHPYPDGNGRTARLLMNYILLCSGYSWITITSEERIKYFKALEKGQVEDNILPFAEFIINLLKTK